MSPNPPDLSIIIISWNVRDFLDACLQSIYQNKPEQYAIEIIVVDSGSNDGTATLIHEQYPEIRFLPQKKNVGFTRGNNIGLAEATGRYLLLLNPDTEIIRDALTTMIHFMDSNPQVGILGPHTLNTDGTTQSSRRGFPGKRYALYESLWLREQMPQSVKDAFFLPDAPDNAIIPVDWVQGSALLARRDVYAQIGGLDTEYVMFWEETDWCKRAKDAGWEVVYLGTAQITHHGGKSTEQVKSNLHIHFQNSKLRYFRKYHGTWFAWVLWFCIHLTYIWQIVLEIIKGLLFSKPLLRWGRIKQYWQVLRSGLRVS